MADYIPRRSVVKIQNELKEMVLRFDLGGREAAVFNIIESLAYQLALLRKLEEHIRKHGVSDEYQNGANQFGTKKTPEADLAIQYSKLVNSTTKTLCDLLPKVDSQKVEDELIEYVTSFH